MVRGCLDVARGSYKSTPAPYEVRDGEGARLRAPPTNELSALVN